MQGISGNDSPDNRVYAVDLQKVILLPEFPGNKDSIFLSRLIVFNDTFAKVHPKFPGSVGSENSFCVLWHEALQGRGAESIVDSLFPVISTTSERDIKSFIFWMDNFSDQNKNWVLYTALVQIGNQVFRPERIILRYLTKGHTHNAADGITGISTWKWKNGQYTWLWRSFNLC